jgi:hypothetical protein
MRRSCCWSIPCHNQAEPSAQARGADRMFDELFRARRATA